MELESSAALSECQFTWPASWAASIFWAESRWRWRSSGPVESAKSRPARTQGGGTAVETPLGETPRGYDVSPRVGVAVPSRGSAMRVDTDPRHRRPGMARRRTTSWSNRTEKRPRFGNG